ncbi:MAG: hypothetical protein ABTQ93_10535 [Candidatus Competibacter denitrificans]
MKSLPQTKEKFLLNRFLFCLFAAIPSLAMIERFLEVMLRDFSREFSIISFISIQGIYLILLWHGSRWFFRKLYNFHQSSINTLWFVFISVLILMFLLIYPLTDLGYLGFASDRDEAIDIAVNELLKGHYPYRCRSISGVHHGCPEKGNLISPLSGGLLLATPFVMMGGSALQNFFWLIAFYVALRCFQSERKFPAIYLITLMLLSPVLIAEILTGGDYLANSLAVTLALILVLNSKSTKNQILGSLLLGVALSWRAHFLLIMIPCMLYSIKRKEFKKLPMIGLVTIGSFILVTLPFWLANPVEFTPIHIQQRLSDFQHLLPHVTIIVVIFSIIVGILGGWWISNFNDLLIVSGMVVTIPILFAVLLNSINVGHLTFLFYGWYALTGTVLGTLGAALHNDF